VKFELTLTQYSLPVRTLRRVIRFSWRFGTELFLLLRGNGNWFRWMLDSLSNQHSLWTAKNNTRSKSLVPSI